MMYLLRSVLTLTALLVLSKAQRYNLHMFDDHPFVEDTASGRRHLQLSTGNRLDLNESADICSVRGGSTEARFGCQDTIVLDADDGTNSSIFIDFDCTLDSQTAFDYRRSFNCRCDAWVTPNGNGTKTKHCPCSICPIDFGTSPIAIDCNGAVNDTANAEVADVDPFVLASCSSFDCGFACNGTCNFNCDQSGPECEFCEGNPGTSPTMTPTGDGNTGGSDGPFGGRTETSTNGNSAAVVSAYHVSTLGLMGIALLSWFFL